MTIKDISSLNYYRYCQLEGNQYIASEFALYTLLRVIEEFKISSILEIGMGIGSIVDTIMVYTNSRNLGINYSGTESNEFCKKALQSNVTDFEHLGWYQELKEIQRSEKFSLIIIDGQDEALQEVRGYCRENTIIFIEGDRKPQMELLMSIFPKALQVNVISLKKNKKYAHGICQPEHFVGGGQLIFTQPNFRMKMFWFVEKIQTYFKRHIRRLSQDVILKFG